MYVLKTEGTDKIPDYIQIRDDSFALITHFKADNISKMLEKIGYKENIDSLTKMIENLEYGILKKI
jgi:hypothetical protein